MPGRGPLHAFNVAVLPALRWNEASNPTGARGTVFDVGRNVYGTDAQGSGRRPFDNVGVQYGLAQLNVARLNAAFPAGVCDWSKAGAGQAPLVPYGSFGPSPVNPVFQRGTT